MKKINSILMILAAAAGFTNCSKAELVENKETEKGGTVVYASTDVATKTTLADDYKVLWSTGDQIKFVKDGATTTTYTFTLLSGEGTTNGTFTYAQTPEDGTYTVYYPATYDGTSWPAQTYVDATDISGAPMKATATVSGGSVSDISFKNEGGILRYTVKGSKTIKSINVKSGSTLDVTLSCGTSGVALSTEGTVFNIALPAGEYSNATLTFTATDNTVATKTASTFTVKKNKVSLATFEATALSFALPGLFTVGKGADGIAGTGDDVQVRFSKGNLYAKNEGTTESPDWKWHFYDEQYQYNSLSTSSSRTANANDTEIDLFTWGYDNTSKNNSYSLNPVNTTGITGHDAEGNKQLNPSAGGDDWGVAYCESNNITVGTWRTLSTAEWQYLFNTRSNASSLYKCGVIVCGKANCVVLLPDNWDLTAHPLQTSYDTESSEGSPMTWEQAEAAGAVCLRAAGYRDRPNVGYVGVIGIYWSSTAYGRDNAYYVNVDSEGVSPGNYVSRFYGCSVRLITESK